MSGQASNIGLPANLFAGKTAIVTGASRGVGRATALRLAESGARVVINYLSNAAEAAETIAMCEARGSEVLSVPADVSEFAGASEIAKKTLERFGAIDLLVCNAGIW